jgi:hypothetical protein
MKIRVVINRFFALVTWAVAAIVLYVVAVLLIASAFSLGRAEYLIPITALSVLLGSLAFVLARAGWRAWRAGSTPN